MWRGDRNADDQLPVDPDVLPVDPQVELAQPDTPPRDGTGPQSFALPRPTRARRWDIALVIAAGGAIGGAARWSVNQALPHSGTGFPWSTFLENVSGCFALAVVMVVLVEARPPSRYARPFIGVGILGGYTTFSTYATDTRGLLAAGQPATAALYLFGTVAAGLVAVSLGLALARAGTGVVPAHKKPANEEG